MAAPTQTTTTTTVKDRCIKCKKGGSTVQCDGCSQLFCYTHLKDHQQLLNKQLEKIEVNRDKFRQTLTQQTSNLKQHVLIKQINQWEKDSIKTIQQIANDSRTLAIEYLTEHVTQLDSNLTKFSEELNRFRQENNFNEIDLNQSKEKLAQLAKELNQPSNIFIEQRSTLSLKKISVAKLSGVEISENLDQDQADGEAHKQSELFRQESNGKGATLQDYQLLKVSFNEIEKRCVKHQKQEIEVKRQIAACQSIINDLTRENQNLKERLTTGTEDYKELHRKYTELECPIEFNYENEETNAAAKLFDENENNTEEFNDSRDAVHENEAEQDKRTEAEVEVVPEVDVAVQQCPVCSCEFPQDMSVNVKTEHIEQHFA